MTVTGAPTEPRSYIQCVRDHADQRADVVAYVHLALDGVEVPVTWADLDRRSSQVAAAMAARGVGLGDLVGLAIRNSPELLFAIVATWKLGAVPIPVRWDVPDWELDRLLAAIEPAVHIGDDDLAWLRATDEDDVPTLPPVVSPHSHGICSSGSTGTPKVILMQTPAVLHPALATPIGSLFVPVHRPQRHLVPTAMYHVNGFVQLVNMLAGDQLFVLEKFDAARFVDVVERERITTFTATPTMLQRVADVPGVDDRDWSSIEWYMQGAAPMPPSLVHRWSELIPLERLVMAYGGTEGLGNTVINGTEWMEHPGSVGRGMGGAEIRILDDDGRELPTGEIGHIFMRTPGDVSVAAARSTYLGDVPAVPRTGDGFASYGDMGSVDAEGYLHLADRRVDMIVTGGANVFPAEVEASLADHPKIADVVVIGLKDAEWGRRVHAVITPTDPDDPPTFEEVRAYVKDRLLPYKVPKSVEIVEEIPRSEATKVNRGRLVEARGG